MKRIFTLFCALMLSSIMLTGQTTVTGTIQDTETRERLIGASVLAKGTSSGTVTDVDGNFSLVVPEGTNTLEVSYIGYTPLEIDINNATRLGLISLTADAVGLEAIQVIAAIAQDRKTPVAVSTISGAQIENKLGNQEFVEVLKATPSIYTTKSGGGFGDARINVRGFTQENVAVLINGISVSGMEDNKVYWSNWAGLGDVTRTIQVQRGLGASRLAISSVGGTINIITKTTDQEKGGSFTQSFGNDGFLKTGLTLSTGRMDGGWAVTFSGSKTTGDGYIEGTYIDAYSYFGSIAKEIGNRHQLVFTVFGAPQKHGQRDFPHNISDLENRFGYKYNDDYGRYQGNDFLLRENFYHKPQAALNHIWDIDEKSSLVTAVYGSVGRGGGTGHLGGIAGNDREFLFSRDPYGHHMYDEWYKYNTGQSNLLADTSLVGLNYEINGEAGSGQVAYRLNESDIGEDVNGDGDTRDFIGNGNIKRASMNEHQWFGVLSTYNHKLNNNFTLTGGVDLRWYTGSHYRKPIELFGADYFFDRDDVNNRRDWLDINGNGEVDSYELGNLVRPDNDAGRLFGSVEDGERIDYHNDENINWYGVFAQLEYAVGKWSTFVSGAYNFTQMRRIDFFNKNPQDSNQTTDWLNFGGYNFKIGGNYNIDEVNNVFINIGHINRTPYFDALFPTFNNDAGNENAEGEKIYAVEAGYGLRSKLFIANLNGYYTQWKNKTEVSDFEASNGDVLFLNLLGVDAIHSGVELDFRARATSRLTFTGFAGLGDWKWSNNPEGTISDDDQVEVGSTKLFLDNIKVGNAAQTTIGLGFEYEIFNDLNISANWFYFDNLFADYDPNDRDDEDLKDIQPLKLPSYNLVDLNISYGFRIGQFKSTVFANINNVFNEKYIAEANDNYEEGVSAEDLLLDTRGFNGFGRTWNAGIRVGF